MQINHTARRLTHVVTRPLESSPSDGHVTPASTPPDRLSVSPPQPVELPDLNGLVEPRGDGVGLQESLTSATDSWVEKNLKLENPQELNVMKGLGRRLATQAKLSVRPDWTPYESADQTTMLWDDEELGARPPLGPDDSHSETSREADKTLGVLRMFDAYLGKDIVDRSVRRFLKQAANGGRASLDEFYRTLAGESKGGPELPSLEAFRGWFSQTGHPILRTSIQGNRVQIRQSGFSVYEDEKVGNEDSLWTIPVQLKFKDSEGVKSVSTLIGPHRSSEIKLPAKGKVEWAYPNGGGMGLFRTALDEEELKSITSDVAGLSPAEQTALACNQWRLVRHGESRIDPFYEMLLSAREYLDPGLVHIALIELFTHKSFLRDSDLPAYYRFCSEVLGPTARKMGLEIPPGGDVNDAKSRRFMIEMMAGAGDADARAVAEGWAKELVRTGSEPAWGAGLITRDPRVARRLWSDLESSMKAGNDPATPLGRLAGLDSPGNLRRVFDFVTDQKNRLEQKTRENTLWSLTYAPAGRPLVLKALKENPKALSNRRQLLDSLAHSSYRDQVVDLLAQSTEIEPDIRNSVLEGLSTGSGKTLEHLGDQIHDFLKKREGRKTTSIEWNLVG